MILARPPLRALKIMDVLAPAAFADEHPQAVSRSKLNLRRRKFARRKRPAVTTTTLRAANLCQSIHAKIPLYGRRATGCFWPFAKIHFQPAPAMIQNPA
jgi:hypothetical protein